MQSPFSPATGRKTTVPWLRYALLIVIIIVVTIFIVLFLAAQFNLYSSTLGSFTYGDTVTIRSLATGGYLAPGCSYQYQSGTEGIISGSTINVITADASADIVGDRTQWIIVPAPPGAASQGYAFKNKQSGQYLIIPFFNFDSNQSTSLFAINSQSLAVPLVRDYGLSSIDPSVVYGTSFDNGGVFLFRPGAVRSNIISTSTGSLGVFTISHVSRNGETFLLSTVGTLNRQPSSTGTCYGGNPVMISGCTTSPGECTVCPPGTAACVRMVPFSFYTNPKFSREQFLFKIERATS